MSLVRPPLAAEDLRRNRFMALEATAKAAGEFLRCLPFSRGCFSVSDDCQQSDRRVLRGSAIGSRASGEDEEEEDAAGGSMDVAEQEVSVNAASPGGYISSPLASAHKAALRAGNLGAVLVVVVVGSTAGRGSKTSTGSGPFVWTISIWDWGCCCRPMRPSDTPVTGNAACVEDDAEASPSCECRAPAGSWPPIDENGGMTKATSIPSCLPASKAATCSNLSMPD